jgi:hypothetical protein
MPSACGVIANALSPLTPHSLCKLNAGLERGDDNANLVRVSELSIACNEEQGAMPRSVHAMVLLCNRPVNSSYCTSEVGCAGAQVLA